MRALINQMRRPALPHSVLCAFVMCALDASTASACGAANFTNYKHGWSNQPVWVSGEVGFDTAELQSILDVYDDEMYPSGRKIEYVIVTNQVDAWHTITSTGSPDMPRNSDGEPVMGSTDLNFLMPPYQEFIDDSDVLILDNADMKNDRGRAWYFQDAATLPSTPLVEGDNSYERWSLWAVVAHEIGHLSGFGPINPAAPTNNSGHYLANPALSQS